VTGDGGLEICDGNTGLVYRKGEPRIQVSPCVPSQSTCIEFDRSPGDEDDAKAKTSVSLQWTRL
jgi:hypothetical protein